MNQLPGVMFQADDRKRSLESQILECVLRYQERFGVLPNTCQVNEKEVFESTYFNVVGFGNIGLRSFILARNPLDDKSYAEVPASPLLPNVVSEKNMTGKKKKHDK